MKKGVSRHFTRSVAIFRDLGDNDHLLNERAGRWRWIAGRLTGLLPAILQIPALLVLESAAAVRLVALSNLGQVIPSGMHTYLPLVEAIPLATLYQWAVPSSVLGVALLSMQHRWHSRQARAALLRPSRILSTLGTVVATQLAAYLIQVAYVAQVQGIADAAPALVAAAITQVAIVVIAASLAGIFCAVPRILRSVDLAISDLDRAILTIRSTPIVPIWTDRIAYAPRRGPPPDLLALTSA